MTGTNADDFCIKSFSLFVVFIAILAIIPIFFVVVVVLTLDIHLVFVVTTLPIFTFDVCGTECHIPVPLVQVERVKVIERIFPTRRLPGASVTVSTGPVSNKLVSLIEYHNAYR
jgi:hypothetical protein